MRYMYVRLYCTDFSPIHLHFNELVGYESDIPVHVFAITVKTYFARPPFRTTTLSSTDSFQVTGNDFNHIFWGTPA